MEKLSCPTTGFEPMNLIPCFIHWAIGQSTISLAWSVFYARISTDCRERIAVDPVPAAGSGYTTFFYFKNCGRFWSVFNKKLVSVSVSVSVSVFEK